LTDKFHAAWTAGSRIVPSRSSKNEEAYQIRINAAEVVDNRFLRVCVQANSQATVSVLKAWLRKYGSLANLAEGQYDTKAADPDAETKRLLDDIKDQMDKHLGYDD
jgi:hypothetical protein